MTSAASARPLRDSPTTFAPWTPLTSSVPPSTTSAPSSTRWSNGLAPVEALLAGDPLVSVARRHPRRWRPRSRPPIPSSRPARPSWRPAASVSAWPTAWSTCARPTPPIRRSRSCPASWSSWPPPASRWTAWPSCWRTPGPRSMPSRRRPSARSGRRATWWPARSRPTRRCSTPTASSTTCCPACWAGATRSATSCWPRTRQSCDPRAATRAPSAPSRCATARSWSRTSSTPTS